MRGLMKTNRKSTMIAYWVLRTLAISSALLLFSVTGIVALQTATHATAIVIPLDTTTSGINLSPADSPTSPVSTPPVPTDTPVSNPTATPVPTSPPTQVPTKTPTKPPVPGPTPTPRPIPTSTTPPAGATPTSTAATSAGGVLPSPAKGTPKAKPSPTPPGSPTPGTSGTQGPAIPNENTPTNTQSSSGGITAMLKPLVWPIVGVSTAILLSSAGLLGLMLWKKRASGQAAADQLQSSPSQASASWANQQAVASNNYYGLPAEATLAQKQPMSPFGMQSIAQYSPLLGAPNSSHLDAPAPPPASDFRPLTLDYPQIMEVHTDKMSVPMLPSTLQSLSPTANAEFQPALQLASTPFSPMPDISDAGSPPTPAQTPLPLAPQIAPTPFQFPPHDSSLENLMHQAQMGIFSLPGKEA